MLLYHDTAVKSYRTLCGAQLILLHHFQPAEFVDPNEDLSPGSPGSKIRQPSINLVELHSSISNMVAAMVMLEKAVTEKSTEDDIRIMKQNIKKVRYVNI